jgi:hypothetical protein
MGWGGAGWDRMALASASALELELALAFEWYGTAEITTAWGERERPKERPRLALYQLKKPDQGEIPERVSKPSKSRTGRAPVVQAGEPAAPGPGDQEGQGESGKVCSAF